MRTILFLNGLFIIVAALVGCTTYIREMQPGNINVPHERTIAWKTRSAFADSVILSWSNRKIDDEKLSAKGNTPRIVLAKLVLKTGLAETNAKIRKIYVRGVSGSSWALNKKGDYDFTLTPLTTILFLFGNQPDVLFPETKDYLLNVLLTEDGNRFRRKVPHSLGLAEETENHILMTEGSRYLKNRWMMLHGNNDVYYDNMINGMEDKLLAYLTQMKTTGLYEFNSLPYTGYTISALLNLEAFASEKVSLEARNVLDYMNWTYALGSYQLKHFSPMRRRYDKEYIKTLTTDYQSVFMKSWLGYSSISSYNHNVSNGEVHALVGACMPYRPADKVVEMIFNKGAGYFVKIGHGKNSCPEIYSAEKEFLLSAGGANRGKNSLIVARPICLFLDDTAQLLSSVINLKGPGPDFMDWNNTGVYKNFACTSGPVYVPGSFVPVAKNENWSLYSIHDTLFVAVHSVENFGLVALFRNVKAKELLLDLQQANPDAGLLTTVFQFPAGHKLSYDVHASKSKWVMMSDNNELLNRDFDQWPLVEGDFEK